MVLIAKALAILVGIGILFMFADFLSCCYQDFADYCESIVEDKEKEYELEVDVDLETGQRTSTIVDIRSEPR